MRAFVCKVSGSRRFAALVLTAIAGAGLVSAQIPGRNVNMVSGDKWPDGDPYLQRQNEPSLAASTRNPLHLLAGANDYRTVDLPGLPDGGERGDAWLGLFKSFDGGTRWQSTLLPGYPQDTSAEGKASPIYGYKAAADPVVRAGTNGLFYYSGIVFDRDYQGRSRVFVARFIDNNNKEAGDPFHYLGASAVASNPGTAFIDKPWMAVDVPRTGAKWCAIETPGPKGGRITQRIRAGNVYISYSVIAGTGADITSTIMFSRSVDCGVTWSTPIAISRPTDKVNQGSTIAVDPSTGSVYVGWRKFGLGNEMDGIVVVRSINGQQFQRPSTLREFESGRTLGQLIAFLQKQKKQPLPGQPSDIDQAIAPFDLKTLEDQFRTNAYPTMAIDGNSRVYVAWSERGFRSGQANGQDASIVMSTGVNGAGWTPAFAADLHGTPGHQFMPSLAFAGGKLMLVYYDLREDVSGFFNEWVNETAAIAIKQKRHTIDLRATQADPAATPSFAASVQVSEYVVGSRPNSKVIEQLQFNPPNLPLFQLGEVPFIGDYVDIAAAPSMLQDASGTWRHNTAPTAAPVFHAAWTDNRDVRPPTDKDWKRYTPPTAGALRSTFDPSKFVEPCEPGRAGMRNQNVYTSRITAGLVAGSPGNAKPLHPTTPRGFVVFAQNATASAKLFRFTIESQPVGGWASFNQLVPQPPVTRVDVTVPARSTVSRTVFATSTDPHARVPVDVTELQTTQSGALEPKPGGLTSEIVLNPDISNPDISNPDISNPDISNPDISNPDISNAEVYNPDISNPDISNPDISNPDISNPDISNPDISNVVLMNPDISNPDISNPDISNPDISNPDISNPDISNPDISNGSLTDVTWTVTNKGNTTASYDVNLLASANVPGSIKTQLIIHKTYTTPVSDGCTLKQQTQTVLVTNITNPNLADASLWLEPGASGKITLRIVDPDPRDDETFNPIAGDTAVTPQVTADAINTTDLTQPDPEPPAATPPTVSSTSMTVVSHPSSALVGATLGSVQLLVQRTVDGVTTPLANATVVTGLVVNPGGAQLGGQSSVATDANGIAVFGDLTVDRPASGYQLGFTASTAGALPVSSALFDVTVPAADPTQNVFIVTTTANDGPGSLRYAIERANTTANGIGGPDLIVFGFRLAGTYTIGLTSPLPEIVDAVVIDGTTQAGYNAITGQPAIQVAGTGANQFQGFVFVGNSANSTIRALSLTGFGSPTVTDTTAAIRVGTTAITIEGNWIGVSPAGTPIGNKVGIWITSGSATIGGAGGVATRNVISAGQTGIFASGGTGTTIRGNFIGTSPSGLLAYSNTNLGINLQPGVANTIIGGAVGAGYFTSGSPANLISGNLGGGIEMQDGGSGGPFNTQILGNIVGLAIDGTDLGNGVFGIAAARSSSLQIGAPGAGNVVSGNGSIAPFAAGDGIVIRYGSGNPAAMPIIQSNYVGTDADGIAARPNVFGGIVLEARAKVGGTGAGEGNVIAGNGHAPWAAGTGINTLENAGGTVIQGNTIGLNALGQALGNGYSGITVYGTGGIGTIGGSVTIGGNVAAARNVISGNPHAGIAMYTVGGPAPRNIFVRGNYIGTDASGNVVTGVGNGVYGVSVTAGSSLVQVGGAIASFGNRIAGNGVNAVGAGVYVGGPTTTTVRINSNEIFDNNGLGIDLGATGVLANDTGDGDTGENGRQNHPELWAVRNPTTGTGFLRVRLDSQPGTYLIQVFSNTACDPSGYGEGRQMILEDSITVTSGPLEKVYEYAPLVVGLKVTATATDASGNTSEFSNCETVASTNALYWRPSVGGNGHFYEYVKPAIFSWNAANAAANARSLMGRAGHLVTITSAGENAFVTALKGTGDLRAWIGLTDLDGSNTWDWVTGEPFVYSSWNGGEPNNMTFEHWVEIHASGGWNNVTETFNLMQGYLVEYPF